jgi:hypothetical protein
LSEEAFLRDFGGDLEPARARALFAVQGQVANALVTEKTSLRVICHCYLIRARSRI